VKVTFLPIEGQQIEMPEKFRPDQAFLVRHRAEIFLGSSAV
jgi:hypothetical protein